MSEKRVFRNRNTGHRIECDIVNDKHLIVSLEHDIDYQELIFGGKK